MGDRILDSELFLSFYGDDFTGSTDVMESLALNGVPTTLFLDAPEKEEVDNFQLKLGIGAEGASKKLKAFGVAGISRSLNPSKMDDELPRIFEKISRIPTDFFQYKACSTFDSAPQIGSIGHASEIAIKYFPSAYIPLVIGAPFLNRFVVFGNLYARVGQETYRLDRHPTMSKHPVTPMSESDLRLHLGKQTSRNIRLIDHFALSGSYGTPQSVFQSIVNNEGDFILFDTLEQDHLVTVGQLLIENKQKGTQFFVGASGADYALAFYLQQQGKINKPQQFPQARQADKMLVIAGSCSPATAGQIDHMEDIGHCCIRINTQKLVNETDSTNEIELVISLSQEALGKGQIPVLYTAKGPDDPSIKKTMQLLAQKNNSDPISELLAGAQAIIARELIEKAGKMRISVAGGDTSGYVSKALGIYALETLCPIAPGAPLCIAHSKNNKFDGLEIALKGGQNGNKRYFESILKGKLLD